MFKEAVLGLGSNIGDSDLMLNKAIDMLNKEAGTVQSYSSNFYSEAWGFSSPNEFSNKVVLIKTELPPKSLLMALFDIEKKLGRKRDYMSTHYKDRCIDIDIILYEASNYNEESLIIPHPQAQHRNFVIEPMKEIIGHINHQELYAQANALVHQYNEAALDTV